MFSCIALFSGTLDFGDKIRTLLLNEFKASFDQRFESRLVLRDYDCFEVFNYEEIAKSS